MAQYFFDSSALAKRYHPEPGTPKVLSIFGERDREVRISNYPQRSRCQRARLLMDIAAGEIEVCAWTSDHFRAAERLIGRHSFSNRLRTLDALQLAVALDLSNQGLLDQFVVSDKALGEVASLEGLVVLNPDAL